ncbi:hypothetical protein M3Y99_00835900 [Aphelenchoides fujianensis]|nr:hypothetical protein M3Y99_00835900 [Aphelenchoides fujianensis]
MPGGSLKVKIQLMYAEKRYKFHNIDVERGTSIADACIFSGIDEPSNYSVRILTNDKQPQELEMKELVQEGLVYIVRAKEAPSESHGEAADGEAEERVDVSEMKAALERTAAERPLSVASSSQTTSQPDAQQQRKEAKKRKKERKRQKLTEGWDDTGPARLTPPPHEENLWEEKEKPAIPPVVPLEAEPLPDVPNGEPIGEALAKPAASSLMPKATEFLHRNGHVEWADEKDFVPQNIRPAKEQLNLETPIPPLRRRPPSAFSTFLNGQRQPFAPPHNNRRPAPARSGANHGPREEMKTWNFPPLAQLPQPQWPGGQWANDEGFKARPAPWKAKGQGGRPVPFGRGFETGISRPPPSEWPSISSHQNPPVVCDKENQMNKFDSLPAHSQDRIPPQEEIHPLKRVQDGQSGADGTIGVKEGEQSADDSASVSTAISFVTQADGENAEETDVAVGDAAQLADGRTAFDGSSTEDKTEELEPLARKETAQRQKQESLEEVEQPEQKAVVSTHSRSPPVLDSSLSPETDVPPPSPRLAPSRLLDRLARSDGSTMSSLQLQPMNVIASRIAELRRKAKRPLRRLRKSRRAASSTSTTNSPDTSHSSALDHAQVERIEEILDGLLDYRVQPLERQNTALKVCLIVLLFFSTTSISVLLFIIWLLSFGLEHSHGVY